MGTNDMNDIFYFEQKVFYKNQTFKKIIIKISYFSSLVNKIIQFFNCEIPRADCISLNL